MLLALQRRQPTQKPQGASYAPPAPRGTLVVNPAAPRAGGRPSQTFDAGPTPYTQDTRFPIVSRYLPLPDVQRQNELRVSRSYPDIHAGWAYPPPVEAPAAPRAGGRRATQTDFALRRPIGTGPRWNGLLLGLQARVTRFQVPAGTTYAQAVGFALVWAASGGSVFPTQYFGLRAYYHGAVKDLCLVAVADAPAGMGGVVKVRKGSTDYAVYLVETSDANASPIRIRTSSGTKAVREKT